MNEETLFELALNTPEAERFALLDRECAGNLALRARIEARLRQNQTIHVPHEVVEPVAQKDISTDNHRTADDVPGVVIAGRYKLLQQIGEGGMGTVWMADQTEPVKRRVAVKLIRVDRGSSKTILSRFEAERQAIALMDHPHIAKLLDAGTTSSGLPFFIMELVKGVPLTEYCDTHRLSIPDRLQLFMQICSAVQHAHQKGIIHRDLKPSNILVESHDGKPVPKVIDFGLAKATSGLKLSEDTLFTGFGTVLGTPLYMAPEQATFNAIDVDTRADVYALGVILYELLTGTTPLTRDTIKKAAMEEMLRLIREQDAPTPSSRFSTSDAKPTVAANRHTEPAKLGRVALELLKCGQFAVAEEMLRECVAICQTKEPEARGTFNTQSMFGGALLGQKKYVDAEPLLLKGFEGMKAREKTIPLQGSTRIPEALDRLIALYTATKKPDEAKKWQAERAKYPEVAPLRRAVVK